MDARHQLLMAAISDRLGRPIGSDQLIKAALDALAAGIDSPTIAQLAGLTRAEEPEARDLFEHVIDELQLAPSVPDHPTQARWALVRWWCQLITDGTLAPEVASRLILWNAFTELGSPTALKPLVGWVIQTEDWTPDWDLPRETLQSRIVAEARQLLAQPWPPADQ